MVQMVVQYVNQAKLDTVKEERKLENMASHVEGSRLGKCEVCDDNEAKYTCPRCELKTCCVSCVNIHKKEFDCNGQRDKVGYKPISKFTNLDLLGDYRLMEETTRKVETFVRNPAKQYTRTSNLPFHLHKLRTAASQRGIDLHFLPRNFSRNLSNTTFFDWKQKLIHWRVEWIFPQAGNIKCITERLLEDEILSKHLNQYLDPLQCDPILWDKLQFYQSAGHKGIVLLMKTEKSPGVRYHELDSSSTLKANLRGKVLIEFPIIYILLKDHKYTYDILNSEEEAEIEKKVLGDTPNEKPTNFLFNASDSSDDNLDGNEEGTTSENQKPKQNNKRRKRFRRSKSKKFAQ